jgi:hypothetical protein
MCNATPIRYKHPLVTNIPFTNVHLRLDDVLAILLAPA